MGRAAMTKVRLIAIVGTFLLLVMGIGNPPLRAELGNILQSLKKVFGSK